jgi:hypothetical protein
VSSDYAAGVEFIETQSQQPLDRFFVRMAVSGIQTDTILAILAQGLWLNVNLMLWRPAAGENRRVKTTISLMQEDDGMAPDQTRALKKIILNCRERDPDCKKGWIDKDP